MLLYPHLTPLLADHERGNVPLSLWERAGVREITFGINKSVNYSGEIPGDLHTQF